MSASRPVTTPTPTTGGTSANAPSPTVLGLSTDAASSGTPDCGANWMSSLKQLNKSATQNVDQVQIISWNDYEAGKQIEAGVDGCIAITPAATDTGVTWSTAGNTESIDHYTVYASTDGVNYAAIGDAPATASSYDLSTLNTTDTQATVVVQAVGKSSFINKTSSPVTYNPNSRKSAPQISVSPTSGTYPLTVSATVSSNRTASSTTIDFGDGTKANSASASHTYTKAGTFTVTGTITDTTGYTSSSKKTVTASAPAANQSPVAKLAVTPTSGTAPLAVTASTSGSTDADGTIASVVIDFGDGTKANSASASHTYSAAGTYTVTTTVTDNGGLSASATSTVTASAPANQAPVAKLAVTPTCGTAPLAVTASTAGSTDADGTIASVVIDFGDGTTANSASASHTYSTAGTYTVKATVTDNGGLSASAASTVTASAPANQAPVAKLAVTPTTGTAPLAVTASTAGSSDPDGTIASVVIDFGDGTKANSASASHTYSGAGTYTVKATVTDNGGLSASATSTVTASAPANQAPVAKLAVTPTTGIAPLAVTASTAGSTDTDGTIASVVIDFGDGTKANSASASHTYNTAGTYSIIATVTDNGGLSASAATSVIASAAAQGSGWTTHGMTIQSAHPRLWWNASRLAQAQAWRTANSGATMYDPWMFGGLSSVSGYMQTAWDHVVKGTDCSAAVSYAVAWAPSAAQVTPTANGSDDMRGSGETPLLIFDWCYDQFSAGQKSTFIANWNTWLGNVMQQSWGGYYNNAWMVQDNYFWGNLRNEFDFAVATYGDNTTQAETFLNDALNTRWATFVSAAAPGGASEGGVVQEGPGYGVTTWTYMMVPFQSALTMGRDLANETTFEKAGLYWLVYNTMPALTYNRGFSASEWMLSDFNDQNTFDPGDQGAPFKSRSYYQGWLLWAANYWGNIDAGKYSRQLFNTVKNAPSRPVQNYLVANDAGGTTKTFDSLPLDFYGSGAGYFIGRKAWDTTSTITVWQMQNGSPAAGHQHHDFGNFQMWRNGRWLTRESTGYSQTLPNYNSAATNWLGATVDSQYSPAHNVVLINGNGSMIYNKAAVKRLESQPAYSYADVDLTSTYQWDSDHQPYYAFGMGHYEREYIFVRSLETLVVLDRLLTVNSVAGGGAPTAANAKKTFLIHFENNPTLEDSSHLTATNGTQALRMTTLVPSSVTYRVINEAACSGCSVSGQYRVEIDQSGTPQSYFLHVLQARDSSAANVTASVVDSNPADPNSGTFTVTLHPASGSDTTIVFNKGQASSGGTVNGVALRNDVQSINYTDAGPVWMQ